MALEDFFTLTEIKDGFTTPARVEELISAMQKEKENVIKNIGDAARQWSTVAGVLAATEDKDCWDQFIQLDGLKFLNQWLQEVQKSADDVNKSFLEETIDALLQALEKMPLNKKRINVLGVRVTLECLIAQDDFKGRGRVKALLDNWSQEVGKDTIWGHNDGASLKEDSHLSVDVRAGLKEDGKKGVVCHEDPGGEGVHGLNSVRGSDVSEVTMCKDVEAYRATQSYEVDAGAPLEERHVLSSSSASNISIKASSIAEESSKCRIEVKTSIGANMSPITEDENAVEKYSSVLDVPNGRKKIREVLIDVQESSSCRSSKKESSVGSGAMDSKGADSCIKSTSSADSGCEKRLIQTQLDSVGRDIMHTNNSSSRMEHKSSWPGGSMYSQSNEILRANGGLKRRTGGSDLKGPSAVNSFLSSGTFKLKPDSENVEKSETRKSDMEIDYAEDALEVARLVAMEVEREVVDYREPSCGSSSGKKSEDDGAHPSSPDSSSHTHDEIVYGHQNPNGLSPSRPELSDEGGTSKVKRQKLSNDTDEESEAGNNDLESNQSAGAPEESVGNADKTRCDFDLNEVISVEEVECSLIPVLDQPNGILSAPIPVLATSRGVLDLHVARPQFEGELGWKGSAATSAFRPASPRRTIDKEKSYLSETSCRGSRQGQNLLQIDLNVAESDDAPAADRGLVTHAPVSSGLPSGESSVEVSSRKAERLKLDLNRLEHHDEVTPFQLSDRKLEGRLKHSLYQNGNHALSPASSSSSRQPSVRDFDLNDNPSLFDACGFQLSGRNLGKQLPQENRSYGGLRLDNPVISVLGSRPETNREDFMNRTQSLLPGGAEAKHTFNTNFVGGGGGSGAAMRPLLAYTPGPPAAYGYYGLNMGTPMPFPQIYGTTSTPYMIDSRGGTVIPQIMGSAPGVPQPFSRPPFLMSVTGPPSGMNGFESRSLLDLNSGMAAADAERRDLPGLRQLFVPRPGILTEEQMKSSTPIPSGMSTKQKEPDCGRELNLIGCKQEPASWHR